MPFLMGLYKNTEAACMNLRQPSFYYMKKQTTKPEKAQGKLCFIEM